MDKVTSAFERFFPLPKKLPFSGVSHDSSTISRKESQMHYKLRME